MHARMLVVAFALTCAVAANGAAKKVLYIDSYHEGYAWSDGITKGIKEVIGPSGNELKIFRMDTKRNTSEEFKKAAGLRARDTIEAYKPDIVIASDDNSSAYCIAPFYKGKSLPVVFCGINWDCSIYGFPTTNITGMLEVSPVPMLLDKVKAYAKGDKLGFLGPELETAHLEYQGITKRFNLKIEPYFAKNEEDYRKGFLDLQKTCDIVIIESDGGLYAKSTTLVPWMIDHTTKATTSMYDFVADRALISVVKSAEEQGSWSATTALKILAGAKPSDIPVVGNKEGYLYLNMKVAKKLGVTFDLNLVKMATKVIE